jgi:hypothetical protein
MGLNAKMFRFSKSSADFILFFVFLIVFVAVEIKFGLPDGFWMCESFCFKRSRAGQFKCIIILIDTLSSKIRINIDEMIYRWQKDQL